MIKKLHLNLCSECIEDLKTRNPYVDENGIRIPIEELDITKVPFEKCRNYTLNGVFVNLKGESK